MKKHILIGSTVLALGLAPVAALAADNASDHAGASKEMKGPPNANGAEQGRSESNSSETNAKAPASGGDNGAASAKATGESDNKKPK